MKLCTCNNCGGVFEDTNPQIGATDYPEEVLKNTEILTLEDHSCPVCVVDDYLVDGVNAAAGEQAKQVYEILSQKGLVKN